MKTLQTGLGNPEQRCVPMGQMGVANREGQQAGQLYHACGWRQSLKTKDLAVPSGRAGNQTELTGL